jgi:homopolymeric O-antigen transport system ATP-binding protein
MADDIVIRAEGLGKKYVIGHEAERERYVALRDVIARGARNAWRMAADMVKGRVVVPGDTVEEFWALKDVSFEVKRGEVLGIIGRNGAGKSTLLKVLSRITEPTKGRACIRGRVASLLEVGTGFHPELTGRENIFLNGAILGMTRTEIRRKFDEIVAFAEVEKFLDTPVKRYSSGMYVRLAFAVAAHLEPEILVVDEVLSVGDAEFQKKCLGKMEDVAGHGRTVLFVSHNMAAVQALCQRSIQLASGHVIADADTHDVVVNYLNSRKGAKQLNEPRFATANGELAIEYISVHPPIVPSGENVELIIGFQAKQAGALRECAVLLYSAKGVRLAVIDIRSTQTLPFRYTEGSFSMTVRVAHLPLVEGDYTIGLYVVSDHLACDLLDLHEFSVTAAEALSGQPVYPPEVRGLVALEAESTLESRDQEAFVS